MNSDLTRAAFLFLVLHYGSAFAAPANVTVEAPDERLKAQARTFFEQQLRPDISASEISEAIRKFHSNRLVYQVRVYRSDDGESPAFRVVVTAKPRLAAVDVHGNEALDAPAIVSQLGITAGDTVAPDRLNTLAARVREYYGVRGFPAAEVSAALDEHDGPSSSRLVLNVKEGSPCLLSQVELTEDRPVVEPEKLKDWMGIRAGDRCDLERIEKGTRNVVDHLRDNGRLSASVEQPALEIDPRTAKGNLKLKVMPGPKIHLIFRGNTFFFERETVLTQAAAVSDERQFNRGWIEATASEGIRQFYRSQGYLDAKIQAEELYDEVRDEKTISFRIVRGPKSRIRDVRFEGVRPGDAGAVSDAFWASAPESAQRRAYVPEELDRAVQGVLAYYQSRGFLKAVVSEPKVDVDARTSEVTVSYRVQEGEQSVFGDFTVTGNRVFSSSEIQSWMGVHRGRPVDPIGLSKETERLVGRYKQRGYKFALVSGPAVDAIPGGTVNYALSVEEGPVVSFGEIFVKGNLNTKDYVVRRELKIKEGGAYDPDRLRDSRRALLKLGFFQQVSLEEANFDAATGREDVIVRVEERKTRSVKFRTGYSTDEGVRGGVDLGWLNIGGTGRSAAVSSLVSRKIPASRSDFPEITQHRVVVTYQEPWIFDVVSGRVNYIDERASEKQFDIDRRSFIVGIDRDWTSWLRTSLQWEIEQRRPFHVQPGVQLSPFDQKEAYFGSISPIVDLDFRDDFLNPKKGSFHRLRFDLYNDLLLSDADFMQVYVRNTFYTPIYKRIRMVTALRVGFSATYGKTVGTPDIPIEKRFRLGGSASLRGFSRNCVGGSASNAAEQCNNDPLQQATGGNAMFNYMNDLLFPLFGGFDLALFTDGGNAYVENKDFNPFDIRTTAGVGLRYNTFFGPLRFDVGFKLDRRPGENRAEIHFAVGQF